MNHRKTYRKLGRNTSHRRAMMRNLATSLVLHNRIETTLPRAKELKRVADSLVTLGKKNTLHARRQAMSYLFEINKHVPGSTDKRSAVHKLFEEIAPRYSERSGGYTRVVRTRRRDGDNAQLAIIEFVEEELTKKKAPKRRRRIAKTVSDVPTSSAQDASPDAEQSVSVGE